MPNQIYIALGLLLVLGLIFTLIALRAWLARRAISGSINTVLAAFMLSLFATCILLLANIYTYQQFTQEKSVATLRFEALAKNSYRVHLHDVGQNTGAQYKLHGDIWQLDVRILKWKNAGTLLGLKPLYRLERLSGRYGEHHTEPNKSTQSHRLSLRAGVELWKIAGEISAWLPLLDVIHGNASYMPMADGAHYQVTITRSGLVSRPINDAAKSAVARWN